MFLVLLFKVFTLVLEKKENHKIYLDLRRN